MNVKKLYRENQMIYTVCPRYNASRYSMHSNYIALSVMAPDMLAAREYKCCYIYEYVNVYVEECIFSGDKQNRMSRPIILKSRNA